MPPQLCGPPFPIGLPEPPSSCGLPALWPPISFLASPASQFLWPPQLCDPPFPIELPQPPSSCGPPALLPPSPFGLPQPPSYQWFLWFFGSPAHGSPVPGSPFPGSPVPGSPVLGSLAPIDACCSSLLFPNHNFGVDAGIIYDFRVCTLIF